MNSYDVVVLDRDLPKVHGDAVCTTLVGSRSAARILMLTAAATVGDRVQGLNLGADDYLGKPFAFEELVARVRSLARRAPAAAPVIVRGDIVFDRARRRVSRAGRPLSLTRKEMGILEELLVADGGVVAAEDLLERVWDENADPFTRTAAATGSRERARAAAPGPPAVAAEGQDPAHAHLRRAVLRRRVGAARAHLRAGRQQPRRTAPRGRDGPEQPGAELLEP
jgi:DNA-binding response OmpR family regulator